MLLLHHHHNKNNHGVTNAFTIFGGLTTTSVAGGVEFSERHSFSMGFTRKKRISLDRILINDDHEPCYPSFRCWLTMMGKGDGKKKRKKKSTSGGTPAGSSDSAAGSNDNNNKSGLSPQQPPPMRVTNDINIPIKRQIRYAQMNKEYQRQQANPGGFRQKKVVRTKYRRTWDEEEIEQKMISAASSAHLSKSKWISQIIREKVVSEWPQSILDMAGSWKEFPDLQGIRSDDCRDIEREVL